MVTPSFKEFAPALLSRPLKIYGPPFSFVFFFFGVGVLLLFFVFFMV